MDNLILSSATIGIVISLLAYEIGLAAQRKWKLAILNPLLISIALVIVFLVVFHVDYDSYNMSAKYLSYLLTPATVCLAIPLYLQLDLLKNNIVAILTGVFSGVLASLGCVLAMSVVFGLNHKEYVTMLPKSITTAIGMGISEELGGYVTISVAVIIITGVLGNMSAEFICKMFRIRNSISKGLAIGTASHAVGTARAMEMGEVEGAMSSLAIVVCGLCTVIGASIFSYIWETIIQYRTEKEPWNRKDSVFTVLLHTVEIKSMFYSAIFFCTRSNSAVISLDGAFVARLTRMIRILENRNAGSSS